MFPSRPYAGLPDLATLSTFLGHARQDIHQTHHLHPGDLVWQLFHMQAPFDPATIVRLWEDTTGVLHGFVLVYPVAGFFDFEVRAALRGSTLEQEMVEWAEQQLWAPVDAPTTVYTLVNEHDAQRHALLQAHGFRRGDPWLYLERSLGERLPAAAAPAGYQIRFVQGMREAEQRAAVLAAAFGAPTQPERYRRLMATPGYTPSLDIVAVAATGQFGAFALGWLDPVSKVGQFEPVGTAPANRRVGLGRAVLLKGMRQLHAIGAERVIVIVEQTEDVARRLYESVGMVARWRLFLYAKERA